MTKEQVKIKVLPDGTLVAGKIVAISLVRVAPNKKDSSFCISVNLPCYSEDGERLAIKDFYMRFDSEEEAEKQREAAILSMKDDHNYW